MNFVYFDGTKPLEIWIVYIDVSLCFILHLFLNYRYININII